MDNHLHPGPDCLDADTLALWAERALPPSQLAIVEAHVADCERCQELVATFAMTDTVVATAPQPVALPLWRQWWMPLTGVAAAATITTVLFVRYAPSTSTPSETTMATAETKAAPAPAAPAPAPAPTTTTAAQDTARTETPQPQARRTQPETPPVRAAKPAAAEPESMPPPPPPAPAPVIAAMPPPSPPSQPPVAAASARQAPPPAQVTGGVSTGVMAMPRPTAGITIGSATATEKSLRADTSTADRDAWTIVPMAQFSSQLSFGSGVAGGRGGTANVAAVTAPRVVTHWRILSATRVSKSNDTKTWTPIDLTPLGEIAITAGAAPTADVCWLVGKNGLVLRTTDATTFVRLTFPEAVDLTTVTSLLALDATVTTSTGHRYRTQDGGATWVRVSEVFDFGTNRH